MWTRRPDKQIGRRNVEDARAEGAVEGGRDDDERGGGGGGGYKMKEGRQSSSKRCEAILRQPIAKSRKRVTPAPRAPSMS